MTKCVETPYAHQKLVPKTLENANKDNATLKQQLGELSYRISDLTDKVEKARREVESADGEV